VAIRLIDNIGRRKVMLIGAALSVTGWLLTFSAQSLPVILISQIIRGLGDVLFSTVVVPMMAELSKGEERTAMFSTSEGFALIGLFLGGWLAGPISEWLWNSLNLLPQSPSAYQGILLFANSVRVLGLLPLLLVRPQDTSEPNEQGVSEGQKVMSYFDPDVLFKISPHIFWLLVPWTLAFFGGGLVARTWNLYLEHTFQAGAADIGRLMGLISLVDGIVTLLAAVFVSWIGLKRLVVGTAAGSAVLLGTMIFAPSFAAASALILIRAAIINMLEPIFRAYVIDQSKRSEYTAVAVLLSATVNIGQFGGPILGGRLQSVPGDYTLVLPIAAVIFIITAYAFWRIVGRERALKPLFKFDGMPK
jgi:MFS family permease